MINNHGFVGYFEDKKDLTYKLNITHSENLFARATSLVDSDIVVTCQILLLFLDIMIWLTIR